MSNHTKFVKQSDGKKWNTGTADFANRFKMADMMADLSVDLMADLMADLMVA